MPPAIHRVDDVAQAAHERRKVISLRQWRIANNLCRDCGEANDSPIRGGVKPTRCTKCNRGRR